MPSFGFLSFRSLSVSALSRPFRYRNYRLFFAGQLISLIGTWISNVATSWLVYRLTGSTLLLGVVSFVSQFPTALLSPLGGVVVDRVNRRKVLLMTQTLSMLQSFALAALTLSGAITVGQLMFLGACQGLIVAFDMPARQVLMSEVVRNREDLPNAIALNSAMFNGARLLGPSIGGILIGLTGEGVCFLLDGFSFLAVLASLRAMNIAPKKAVLRASTPWNDLRDGVLYIRGSRPIRSLLILAAVFNLFGTSYFVLMPVFAENVFHGGPELLGFLMGASGLGAFLGATALAMRKRILGLGYTIAGAAIALAVSGCAFGLSPWISLSLVSIFIAGFSLITLLAACNTVIQTLVEDEMRGRVMSFYAMAFTGMMPLGGLAAGWLASHIGAQWTVFAGGALSLGGAAVFARKLPEIRRDARPILVKRGILREEEGTGQVSGS